MLYFTYTMSNPWTSSKDELLSVPLLWFCFQWIHLNIKAWTKPLSLFMSHQWRLSLQIHLWSPLLHLHNLGVSTTRYNILLTTKGITRYNILLTTNIFQASIRNCCDDHVAHLNKHLFSDSNCYRLIIAVLWIKFVMSLIAAFVEQASTESVQATDVTWLAGAHASWTWKWTLREEQRNWLTRWKNLGSVEFIFIKELNVLLSM